MLNQAVVGIANSSSFQNARQTVQASASTPSVERVKALNPDDGSRPQRVITSVQTRKVYVLREAPQDFAHTTRANQAGKSYRMELSMSQSKDAVDQAHVRRLGALLGDLRTAEAGSGASFVQKHLDKLMEERKQFLESDQYKRLPGIHEQAAQTENTQGGAEEGSSRTDGMGTESREPTANTARTDAGQENAAAAPSFSGQEASIPDPIAAANANTQNAR